MSQRASGRTPRLAADLTLDSVVNYRLKSTPPPHGRRGIHFLEPPEVAQGTVRAVR